MKKLLLIGCLLLLAGCGGNSSGTVAPGRGNVGAPPSSSDLPPFPRAAAQAAAESALLQLSDFPTGWSTSKDTSSSDNDQEFQQQLASCLHVPAALFDSNGTVSAHADTPDFDSPDGDQTISEGVEVSTLANVNTLFRTLQQSNATDCLASTMNSYMQDQLAKSNDPDIKQAKLGTIQVGQLSFPSYGDATVALRATVPVEAQGLSLSVHLDFVFIQHANAAAVVSFEDEGSGLDPDAMEHYAKVAAKRLTRTNLPSV